MGTDRKDSLPRIPSPNLKKSKLKQKKIYQILIQKITIIFQFVIICFKTDPQLQGEQQKYSETIYTQI
jgi:hypothetical protein